MLAFIDRLVAGCGPKRDLLEALASAGVEVKAPETAAALRAEIGHLLVGAQRAGTIRGAASAS